DTVYHVRASRSLSQSTRSGKYEYHAPHSRGTPKTEVTWKSTYKGDFQWVNSKSRNFSKSLGKGIGYFLLTPKKNATMG
ncbi:MAG: hypothetical protein WBG50_04010, partial [Desulfomonilaceae bacterium]